MDPNEFDALVAAAGKSTASAVALLQFMRVNKVHQPELALVHGVRLLRTAQSALGNEVWTVMEQVFFASVELGMCDWRDYCIEKLGKKFPASVRVQKLKGLQQESSGNWAEARSIYGKILLEKPEDVMLQKRLITILKQQGKQAEAAEQLTLYLDTYSTDTEAWHELGELYIELNSLQRAVFCYEELVVASPRSMYHILTYAELLYSTGDLELSRKYYSLAAYIDGSSLRALWGLLLVNAALQAKDNSNDKLNQLQIFTTERLQAAYKGGAIHQKLALRLLRSDAFGPAGDSKASES